MNFSNSIDLINENPKSELPNGTQEKFNLLLFSAGKLVSLLGTYIYSFAISLYILKATGSGTSFAFSILIGTLPRVLFSPIAGSLSDRINKKKMVVTLDFLSGTVMLALLSLSLLFGLQISFLYIATFLLAAISTFFNTCFSAAIPRLVSDKNLVKINSYNRAIESGSSILGPVLAGIVFGLVSMNLFLLINGISFLLSAISELFINFELNQSQQEHKSAGKMSIKAIYLDIKEVFIFIKGNKILSLVMPFSMICNFIITACIAVVLPFQINNVLGMSSTQYGAVEGAFSVGMLVAALVVGKLPEKERRKRMAISIIGMGVSLIIMGLPGLGIVKNINVSIIFIIYVVMAIMFAYFILSIDIPLMVVMQRLIPDNMMGRVMGVCGTISSSFIPFGIILAGITLDIIPAFIIFVVAGLFFIIASFVMYKSKAMQEY